MLLATPSIYSFIYSANNYIPNHMLGTILGSEIKRKKIPLLSMSIMFIEQQRATITTESGQCRTEGANMAQESLR